MSHHLITITHNNRGGPCPLVGHGISIWGTAARNIPTCALSLPKSGLFLALSLPSFLKKYFIIFWPFTFFPLWKTRLCAPHLNTATRQNEPKHYLVFFCIIIKIFHLLHGPRKFSQYSPCLAESFFKQLFSVKTLRGEYVKTSAKFHRHLFAFRQQ